MQDEINKLFKEIPGYHFEIILFPAGGIIDANGCSECGGDENLIFTSMWKYKRKQSIDTAIQDIKAKITKHGL